MRRPQFTLKTMLWLMALVAAFLGGMGLQARIDANRQADMRAEWLNEVRGELVEEVNLMLEKASQHKRHIQVPR